MRIHILPMWRILILLGTLIWPVSLLAQTVPTLPTLPQAQVSTTRPSINGTSCAGSNLATVQACINAAAALTGASGNLNHEVIITAGSSFTGPLNLATRGVGSTGWIIIRSSGSGSLPEGTRVSPASASSMAKIIVDGSGAQRAIQARDNAHHYWMIGLEVQTATSGANQNMVDTGGDDSVSNRTTTHHFMIDRCYIHGTPTSQVVRGVTINAYQGYTGVIDSHIADIHKSGADSQAVWTFYNPGPILIQNNFLEAGSENIMFGGVSTLDASVIPADITIVRNTISKQAAWKNQGSPNNWVLKALIEFKFGKRILVEGNRMMGSWTPDACSACDVGGFSFRLTVRNDDNSSPYVVLEDLTIRHNKISDVAGQYNLTASDGVFTTGTSKRIHIHNNLWYDMSQDGGTSFDEIWGTGFTAPGTDYTMEHNTIVQNSTSKGHFVAIDSGGNFQRYSCRNNIFSTHGGSSFSVTDENSGSTQIFNKTALDFMFQSNYIYTNNAIVNPSGAQSGGGGLPGNFWPASFTAVQFVNIAGDDYHLAPGSPYKNAGSDGKDLGADIDALEAALAGTGTVDSTPPTPPINLRIL